MEKATRAVTANTKMTGMKCKVYIVDSLDAEKVLAGQRSATINRSADSIDASSKDTEGNWKQSLQGMKEWSIDCDGVLVESDAALSVLEEKFLNSENVDVVVIMQSGTKYKGSAAITDFPIDLPYDDVVTYSISLQGSGPLTKTAAGV